MRVIAAIATLFLFTISANANGVNSTSANCLPQSIKSVLAQVEQRFGKVTIISAQGNRPPLSGGSRSYHESCRAVDFKVSRNQSAAARWLKDTHDGGVGTYSGGMTHIHIDNGPRYRWHKHS